MIKFLALLVFTALFTAANAGVLADVADASELRSLNELPATCPSVQMPKAVADYRSRANFAKGSNVPRSPEQQKAIDAFIKECWMQAVIDKQNKK